MPTSVNSPKYTNNGILTDIINLHEQNKSNSYSDKQQMIKKLKVQYKPAEGKSKEAKFSVRKQSASS